MNDYQLKNLERITFNPRIVVGQACIRGMRIPVSLSRILNCQFGSQWQTF